jgi:hypothetical protein
VLALWTFKQLHNLSWRKLEALARQILPQVPDFSTLPYRVSRIGQERWQAFNRWLAQKALGGERLEVVLADGTGFGFGMPFWTCWRRGAEVRRLRSHGKVVVVGVVGCKRVLLGAVPSAPYSDEWRLLGQWLQSPDSTGWGEDLGFVANALYGMGKEVLAQVRRLEWRGVRDEERQWAQRLWQEHREIYRCRYLVESWIGSVKEVCRGYCRERSLKMAVRAVWGRLLLWNLALVFLFVLRISRSPAVQRRP